MTTPNPPSRRPHAAVEADVRANSQAFRLALPALLRAHPNQWVVFHGGVQQWLGADDNAGLAWAYERYGLDGGFSLHKVEPQRVLYASGFARVFGGPPDPARAMALEPLSEGFLREVEELVGQWPSPARDAALADRAPRLLEWVRANVATVAGAAAVAATENAACEQLCRESAAQYGNQRDEESAAARAEALGLADAMRRRRRAAIAQPPPPPPPEEPPSR